MNDTGRMGIGLVGDSYAGVVIAQALGAAGHAVVGRTIPPEERRESVEAALSAVPVLELDALIRRSEMVILAAEADALDALVELISSRQVAVSGQLFVHLARDRPLSALKALSESGVIPLRLYPLLPLTRTSLDLSLLRGGWCAVSAPAPVLPIAEALAIEMGLEPLVITDEIQDTFSSVVKELTHSSMDFVSHAINEWEDRGIDQAAPALAALARASVERVLRERNSFGEHGILEALEDRDAND